MQQHLPPMVYRSAGSVSVWGSLAAVWRYRQLVWVFALRDLQVRYRQTVVGISWAVLQPVLTMVVFGALFTLLKAQPTTGGTEYPVTAFCALLPWQLFASSLTQATQSLVANKTIITRVWFPRLVLPASSVLACLADFLIAGAVLAGLMCWYGVVPGWAVLCLPLWIGGVILAALAGGIWLSAANAVYRDVQHAVPFLIQIGLFLSPVVYETQAVIPPQWQALYLLNPLAVMLDGFRWSLLQGPAPPGVAVVLSLGLLLLLLSGGLTFFSRLERRLADRI